MKSALTSASALKAALAAAVDAGAEWVFDHGHDDAVVGFGLRIRASGAKTWIFQYGRDPTYRMRLGTWPALSLEKARAKARKHREAVDDGGNPAATRVETKQRAKETFGAEAVRFLARQKVSLKPRSFTEVERHLLKNAKPLHGKMFSGIDRRAIAGLLSHVADAHGPIAANRLRASLSTFFVWVMKEGMIDANPVIATNRAAEIARGRVLSEAELLEVWRALPPGDYGDAVRLLLLTGQRREEIGGLRWDEVDFQRGVILLPATRTKNKREHEVPMSDAVRTILGTRKEKCPGGREFVFGEGRGSYSGWSRSKERLDQRLLEARQKVSGKKAQPLPAWRLHDVRRSVATGMARIGTQPHHIEAVLNHISGHKGGVAGVYNRATYLPEKTAALARWADHLISIVSGTTAKVVALHSKVPA
jgi:integrase